MGSLFKAKSSTVSDPGAESAWGIARPTFEYLNPAGVDFTREVMANPAYTGPRVAGLNPFQINAANSLGGFSNTQGNLGSMALTNAGMNNIGFVNNYGNNAADLFTRFSGDPTAGILNTANQYANNPYVDSLIDASSRDITRNLFENQLPGVDRAAAGSGNLNSTRAGVESAIAKRGAADRLADMSGSIRSQFFGKGLDMGQNQYNQNLTNLLGINSQLLGAGNSGAAFLGAGQDYASNAFNQGINAGGMFQGQDQRVLDADKAQFDEGFANRLAALQALTGIGANTKAQTSAGVTSSPSILSQVAGAAGAAGSMGWKPFSDIRMKENIRKLGTTDAGTNIYSFEYKPEFKDLAGHGVHVGVMAQEIESTMPEAVSMHSSGYRQVDYSKVR